jgi:hypothetical protein
VNVLPLDGRPQGSGIRYVETDAGGRFVIDRLPWGKYSVFAMKEEAGYPDMKPSFYSANMKTPVARITPTAPVVVVSIRLGPRAAIITGSVSDSTTGGPVNAFFTLARTHNVQDSLSTSAPASTWAVASLPERETQLLRAVFRLVKHALRPIMPHMQAQQCNRSDGSNANF